MRSVRKHEVTDGQLQDFLKTRPDLQFDGMRYWEPVKMKGLVWRRTLAYTDPATKTHYLVEDR